jgi:hypothetical protein
MPPPGGVEILFYFAVQGSGLGGIFLTVFIFLAAIAAVCGFGFGVVIILFLAAIAAVCGFGFGGRGIFVITLVTAGGGCFAFFGVSVLFLAFDFLFASRAGDDFHGFDFHYFIAVTAAAAVGASGDTSGNGESQCRQHESFFHSKISSFLLVTAPCHHISQIIIDDFCKNSR